MKSAFGIVLVIITLSCLALTATGSIGDRNLIYKFYLNECINQKCPLQATEMMKRYNSSSFSYDISPIPSKFTAFLTQLFWWSCYDDCRYDAMWQHVQRRLQDKQSIVQYYGKWPFIRIFGMQEPASVLFSVMNGMHHYRYLRKMQKLRPQDCSRMRIFYILNAGIAVLLWVCSSLFHWRDTPLTEKLDYFGAAAHVLFSSYVGTIRVLNVRKTSRIALLSLVCLAMYAAHVCYLTFWKFDYGYNMKANIYVGLYHTMLWSSWALKHRAANPYTLIIMYASGGVALSTLLEIFDFSPIFFIVDAHALWHLTTSFIVPYYEKFFYLDLIIDGRKGYTNSNLRTQLPKWAKIS